MDNNTLLTLGVLAVVAYVFVSQTAKTDESAGRAAEAVERASRRGPVERIAGGAAELFGWGDGE